MAEVTEFICKIDETEQEAESLPRIVKIFSESGNSLAREVIATREIVDKLYQTGLRLELQKFLSFAAYGCDHPGRSKRRPMDVKAMIDAWAPLVTQLAIAHDVDEKDAASAQLDEMLAPILAAPVAQLREFYSGLTQRLKDDPKVPWAVWKLFDFWGENVLDKLNKEEVVGLKTELAKRTAENSMENIPREDWINAMIGALQWRSPERLKEVEESLASGEKPRVRGRESCLFLEVGQKEIML
jgi:hypothetical protein